MILAIETSCDETAVAILSEFDCLRASMVSSQIALHNPYGGVVPELASRNHLTTLGPLVQQALLKANLTLNQIDAFAATNGPGLAPALVVGLSLAKGLAIGTQRPFYAINHIEGHLLSPFFGQAAIPPHLALIVSGGHTLLVDVEHYGRYHILGRTLDDAAGEAFDKAAKLLGLPYPGGIQIDTLAETGNPERFSFPRSMLRSNDFNFSFSGLKTSIRYLIERENSTPEDLPDLCASFREAIVDVLVGKTLAAARQTGHRRIAISGGVSANRRLQQKLQHQCATEGITLHITPPAFCTDNAAMIAFATAHRFAHNPPSSLDTDVQPNFNFSDWNKS